MIPVYAAELTALRFFIADTRFEEIAPMSNEFVESTANELYGKVTQLMNSESGIEKFEMRKEFDSLWSSLDCESKKAVGKKMESMKDSRQDSGLPFVQFNYDGNGGISHMVFSKAEPKNWMRQLSGVNFYEREYFKNPMNGCK